MSTEVTLHPPQEQLRQFVEGELSAGLSVALSAHIERCAVCQRASAKLEAQAVANWDASLKFGDTQDFSELLDKITRQPQEAEAAVPAAVPRELKLDNRIISLPRVLAKIADAGLNWKNLGGGISQAEVRLDDRTKCEFIYMTPGSKAPQHTHRGNEVMLVLDGSFCDELGDYQATDFVVRDPRHRHQPRTEEGCLCFSVLDSPLVFTQGLLRLWNPISRMLFWLTPRFR